jgi:hypothetical protein
MVGLSSTRPINFLKEQLKGMLPRNKYKKKPQPEIRTIRLRIFQNFWQKAGAPDFELRRRFPRQKEWAGCSGLPQNPSNHWCRKQIDGPIIKLRIPLRTYPLKMVWLK